MSGLGTSYWIWWNDYRRFNCCICFCIKTRRTPTVEGPVIFSRIDNAQLVETGGPRSVNVYAVNYNVITFRLVWVVMHIPTKLLCQLN